MDGLDMRHMRVLRWAAQHRFVILYSPPPERCQRLLDLGLLERHDGWTDPYAGNKRFAARITAKGREAIAD